MKLPWRMRLLVHKLLWMAGIWLVCWTLISSALTQFIGPAMTLVLGLAVLGVLADRVVRRYLDRGRQAELKAVREVDDPLCFCPACNRMISTRPHSPECCRFQESYPPRLGCVGPSPCPQDRATVRRLGLRYFCPHWLSHRFSDVEHPHPIHDGLWPTWVIGTATPQDLDRFRKLPGCLEGDCGGVQVLHLPPLADDDVGLCVVDLGGLPERLKLSESHPLAYLRGIWIGRDAPPLVVGRVLDRLRRHSGWSRAECEAIVPLFEEAEPPAELENRLAGWLGTPRSGVAPSRVLNQTSTSAHPLTPTEPPYDALPASATEEATAVITKR